MRTNLSDQTLAQDLFFFNLELIVDITYEIFISKGICTIILKKKTND